MHIEKIKIRHINWVIIFFSFVLYWNSIDNEFAIDDNLVSNGNAKTERGIAAIPELFTSFYALEAKGSYGYRPIVLSSFAIEKQLFSGLPLSQSQKQKNGNNKLTQANISHFVNVVLYAFTCVLLFYFFRKLFGENSVLISLVITLLFLVHPLHTEVVDNIKSRDELFVLIGMIASLLFFMRYSDTSNFKNIIWAGIVVLLSGLSKPTTLVFIGVIPVILYYYKAKTRIILISTSTVVLIVLMILGIRYFMLPGGLIREMEFYENPLFVQGGLIDRFTVGMYTVWFYLKMLVFPKDLSFYYGYNKIPMADFKFFQVWLGLFFYVGVGIYGFLKFVKREMLGLGIVLWFGLMLGFLNIAYPVVGIVADRFTYLFSIGYSIVLAVVLFKIFKVELTDTKLPKLLTVLIVAILIVYSGRVIVRNSNWENTLVLYYNDIKHLESSSKAHSLIANTLYANIKENKEEYLTERNVNIVIENYKKAIEIDTTRGRTASNLGSFYLDYTKDNKSAIKYCLYSINHNNESFEVYYNLAIAYKREGEIDKSLDYYYKTIELNPNFEIGLKSLGKLLVKTGKLEQGVENLERIARSVNDPFIIYFSIANMYGEQGKNFDKTIYYFEKSFEVNPSNQILCRHIAKLYKSVGNVERSNYYLSKCNSE